MSPDTKEKTCIKCKVEMDFKALEPVGGGFERMPIWMEIYQCPRCGQMAAQATEREPARQVGPSGP